MGLNETATVTAEKLANLESQTAKKMAALAKLMVIAEMDDETMEMMLQAELGSYFVHAIGIVQIGASEIVNDKAKDN